MQFNWHTWKATNQPNQKAENVSSCNTVIQVDSINAFSLIKNSICYIIYCIYISLYIMFIYNYNEMCMYIYIMYSIYFHLYNLILSIIYMYVWLCILIVC